MNNNQLLFLIIFFCLYANYFCNELLNIKSNNNIIKNNANTHNKFRRKKSKKNFTKRKLDDEPYEFNDLKIFIDYAEFDDTIPTEFSDIKQIFKNAMEYAKGVLEGILQIQIDSAGEFDIMPGNDKIVETGYGITKHSDRFDQNLLHFNEYNYFLFAKFTELNQESASLILDENPYELGAPLFGIILFNKKREYLDSLDKSKLTQTYLNNLMLHHFIRLMGFDEHYADDSSDTTVIPKEGNVIYLDEDITLNSFTNTLNYAKAYFGCSSINKINLYIDETNTDTYVSKQTNRLYWPKELFSGEILTKFDYSEDPFLSGFTLAFLADLPFLKVKRDFSGDLTKFGEYAGCLAKCENFESNENNFWDCSACAEGYFMAMGSSESETYCEDNNKKDYYFLYNEESQIYKKCDLEIQNCQKCSSVTKCTLCYNGYELNEENGKIMCKKQEEADDNGLSTGAIIGIVFGCIIFLCNNCDNYYLYIKEKE